jgi:hypothetical protein
MVRNWGALDPTQANQLGAIILLPGFVILNILRYWAEKLPVPVAIMVLALPLVLANALVWYWVARIGRRLATLRSNHFAVPHAPEHR